MSSILEVLSKMELELGDPKYEGKSDEEIVAILNKKEDDDWWKNRRFCVEDLHRLRAHVNG
jgi:hypothetical protein